jgi:hypothetical protein
VGIEPTFTALSRQCLRVYKARPKANISNSPILKHTRPRYELGLLGMCFNMVDAGGFEPTTYRLKADYSTVELCIQLAV